MPDLVGAGHGDRLCSHTLFGAYFLGFDLTSFIKDCEAAGAQDGCDDYVRDRLKMELVDPAAMAAAMPEYADEEVLLHADDNITLFLIQLSPNLFYPPHNHEMATTIALCAGQEYAAYYRLRTGVPEQTKTCTYEPGDVISLSADTIHAVGNPGTERSLALHIYFGNLPVIERSLWNPDTGEAVPFTDANYFRFARPLDPTKPYTLPEQTHWS